MLNKLLKADPFNLGQLNGLAFCLIHLNRVMEGVKDFNSDMSELKKVLQLYKVFYLQMDKGVFSAPFLQAVASDIAKLEVVEDKKIQNFVTKGALSVLVPFLSINLTTKYLARPHVGWTRWRQESPFKEIYELLFKIGEDPSHRIDALFSYRSAFNELISRDESFYNAIPPSLIFYAEDFDKRFNRVSEVVDIKNLKVEELYSLGMMLADLMILRNG